MGDISRLLLAFVPEAGGCNASEMYSAPFVGREERYENGVEAEAGQEAAEMPVGMEDMEGLEPAPDKGKGKPSVLKDLQEKKAQAAARPSPVPEKEKKSHEAAL